MKITSFSGDYYFLSNFFMKNVKFLGLTYPSVEHAFQAQKTADLGIRKLIRDAKTCGLAKRHGRSVKLRKNWDNMRVDVMRDILRVKFSDDLLCRKLLLTNDAELIEGNNWSDRFWGKVNGRGKNWLGVLLMELREEFRKAQR